MNWSKVWMGAVAIAATVPLLAAPVGAAESPYTRSDPIGDVARPKGDIVSVKVVNGSTIRLTIKTSEGANPFTSAAWRSGSTWINWDIYYGAPYPFETPDFVVGAIGQPSGTPLAAVAAGDSTPRCLATFTFAAPRTYRVSFPSSCMVVTPSPFRFRVQYRFSGGGGTYDQVPNNGQPTAVSVDPPT